ncbi:hypothetical protein SAMD00019534_099670 [Acytostelium subglobosum LB1]|uniref:hypothetical protein n=1 Tax=Acytostelium subglobosum LB1 TaxID=1410327 RepID=UPI000645100E|nr:hypothetical protein SAMD00019534_099670 [Acytostelium subglobosum LB1]GAM26792.1 hypothetical protein SAMD00019534_099670 [Acytostelium subglobosum LB1]|eukprot:XP_012750453.1 hypothetical protein SAMD00019534_099670 [Acytostelium subglobosum LB1]
MVLQDNSGNQLKVIEQANGTYSFNNLPSGQYCVVGSYPNNSYVPGINRNDNVFDMFGRFCTALGPSHTDAYFAMVKSASYCVYGSDPTGKYAPGIRHNDNVFNNGEYCIHVGPSSFLNGPISLLDNTVSLAPS